MKADHCAVRDRVASPSTADSPTIRDQREPEDGSGDRIADACSTPLPELIKTYRARDSVQHRMRGADVRRAVVHTSHPGEVAREGARHRSSNVRLTERRIVWESADR